MVAIQWIYFVAMSVLSTAFLISLRYCKTFHTLETTCLFMFASSTTLQTFNILVYCFAVAHVSVAYPTIFSCQLQFGFILPCVLVHAIHGFVNLTKLSVRLLLLTFYMLCVSGVWSVDVRLRILQMSFTEFLWTVAIEMVLATLSAIFAVMLLGLLRRRSVI